MPVHTHGIKVVLLVLCMGILVLYNGCSNSGSGSAQAPATSGDTPRLALSSPSGFNAIVADGKSTLPIRIQISNSANAGISNVSVVFSTTAGSLSSSPVVRSTSAALSADQTAVSRAEGAGSVTMTTDASGVAQVLLTAGTLVDTAVVTADALGFRTNIPIAFVAGPAARVQLQASSAALNSGGTTTLTATVADANGNAVAGDTVTFTLTTNATNATLTPTSGTTNRSGQVAVQYTAGAVGGTDTIRAASATVSVAASTSITVTGPPGPNNITLLVSSPQLESSGTTNVTLTALVRDASNNVLSGFPVSFQADSGGVQVVTGTTGPTGTATALLTTGGDPSNRTITLTATTGKLSAQNTVQVTGTNLSISGAASLVLGRSVTLVILLRDSRGTGIGKQSVAVSSALGNPLSVPAPTDTLTGRTTVDVTARVAGTDTIKVTALGATASAALTVSGDNFLLSAPAPGVQVPLNTAQVVTAHWDQAGTPQVDKPISFFATRGNFVPSGQPCPATPVRTPTPFIVASTSKDGNATVNICAESAGPAVISATANVSSGPSSQVGITFIATTVASVIVQASPTTLSVNVSGSTTQQSNITAVLRDAQGNLVANQPVSFSVTDVSGGQIAPASAISDSFGRAAAVYTAGAVPSAKDGVVITAAAGGISSTVALTVTRQPLFITLGTGNQVVILSTTQYAQPYSVLVNDANGNPASGARVELSVLPTRYQKGQYIQILEADDSGKLTCTKGWTKSVSVQFNAAIPDEDDRDQACQNEDTLVTGGRFNGILDPGEDHNHNGRLDPGNVATTPQSVTTDGSGFALFQVTYAKEFTWVEVALEARASVTGSEGTTRAVFFLSGAAADFNNCDISPPGQLSPYGRAITCSCDERTDPTGCSVGP
jgi:hypothetical protein